MSREEDETEEAMLKSVDMFDHPAVSWILLRGGGSPSGQCDLCAQYVRQQVYFKGLGIEPKLRSVAKKPARNPPRPPPSQIIIIVIGSKVQRRPAVQTKFIALGQVTLSNYMVVR